MAKQTVLKGDTSRTEYVFLQDSASAVGAGKSGLAFNTASLTAYYIRTGGSPVAITLATLAAINSAWSSGGFKEADATNMIGLYRFDIPDAVFATGVDKAVVVIQGAANMAPVVLEYELVGYDPENATTLGLTNLDATVSSRLATSGYTTPPTAVQNRTEMDSNSTKLANLDATTSSRLATAGYTTPPTVVQNRAEMDSNSTKLANLDATTSSRLATSGYTAPPAASTIAAAVWDYVVYTGWSAARLLRKTFSLTAGKLANGPTNMTSYAPDGTTAEVVGSADSDGNRTITSYES